MWNGAPWSCAIVDPGRRTRPTGLSLKEGASLGVNAFADLVVAFGRDDPPRSTRLGNPWTQVETGPGSVWTSRGSRLPGTTAAGEPVSVGSWTVWAVGEVFAYHGVEVDPLQRFVGDLEGGTADPSGLDAHAVLFGWDVEQRCLHVWTDRMGTVHAYRGGAPGGASVGTYSPAVAEVSTGSLDWVGITGFCGFGFYPADRTHLEDVRVLRPATWSVFDERGALRSEHRYWDWTHDRADRTDDQLVEEFSEVWSATLARQVRGRCAIVPLSGGLDSRTILAALTASTHDPLTSLPRIYSYGYSRSSVELRVARRVARARGLDLLELVVPPYLLDRIDDVVGSVEGFAGLSVPRQIGVSEAIAPLGDLIVGGHLGDLWFDAPDVPVASSTKPGLLVEPAFAAFAKRGREWLLDRLCAPRLGRDPGSLLRELLRAELERLPDLGDPRVQLRALKTDQWSFRWTLAGTRGYHLARATLLPFYGNDLIDFFLRVPPDRVVGRRLQVAYLLRHHPDLAGVPWQATGLPLRPVLSDRVRAVGDRLVRKAVRTVGRRPLIERNWEVQYLGHDNLPRLVERLSDPEAAFGLGPELLDLLRHPGPREGYAVDVALTLDALCRSADRARLR